MKNCILGRHKSCPWDKKIGKLFLRLRVRLWRIWLIPPEQMTPCLFFHIHPASYTVKRKIQDIWSQMCWWHALAAGLESELSYQIKSVPWRLAQLTSACVWLTVLTGGALKESWRSSKSQTQKRTWCIFSVFSHISDSFSLNGTIKII